MEIRPGTGLGPFFLGVALKDVIQYLRDNSGLFAKVVTRFNLQDPMSMPICLDLDTLGIELRFNPISQRLELIRVHTLKSHLTYKHKTFSVGKTSVPTFLTINEIFGLTAESEYSEGRTYKLHYPGITFVSPQVEKFTTGKISEQYYSLKLDCIYIFVPSDRQQSQLMRPMTLPPLLLQTDSFDTDQSPIKYSPFYTVLVNVSQGISVQNDDSDNTLSSSLRFDGSPQDVLTVLGNPQYISYKIVDTQAIHGNYTYNTYQPDYFYNYFDMGLDILFDGTTHTLKKFILHSNTPAQPNFNLYRKCHYTIVVVPEQDGDDNQNTRQVTPEMKWPEIKELYANSKIDDLSVLPQAPGNPFGPTKFFGFKDIIFEVMDSNNYVSSVTLFKS